MQAFHYTTVAPVAMAGQEGVSLRWVMSKNVDAPTFAMRVIDLEPGAQTEHHTHDWEHEVFVLEGQGVAVDPAGKSTPIEPGTCIYVAPNEIHHFANTGDGVLRFICVIPNPKA